MESEDDKVGKGLLIGVGENTRKLLPREAIKGERGRKKDVRVSGGEEKLI